MRYRTLPPWRSLRSFFIMYFCFARSESVEFTEFQPYHFRRVRLAGGITDATYAM
jgi:hypothetical protein